MRATDQITALGLMAIDPVAKAVAPRFWAAVICVPLLTAFFCSLGITASYLEAVHVLGIDAGTFWQVLRDAVDYRHDFIVAFQKAAVFGGTAALVACYVGYHAEPTIEGTSVARSEEHTSELQSLMRISYAVFCLKKKKDTYSETKIQR